MYRDIPIGTAAPTPAQLEQVRHYFIGTLALDQYYSAAMYESECMELLEQLFKEHDTLLVTGGSMMYIDSLCNGIDDIPTVTPDIRAQLMERCRKQGLERMTAELKLLDPEYWAIADLKNPKRVLHALEICYMTGRTYTSFRTRQQRHRPFRIIKVGLNRPREELYTRIGRRVDCMFEQGLYEEALRVMPYRSCNSLNTVGYKEIYSYLDGEPTTDGKPQTMEYVRERIASDTRTYARKQLTWFRRDTEINWFNPSDKEAITTFISNNIVS